MFNSNITSINSARTDNFNDSTCASDCLITPIFKYDEGELTLEDEIKHIIKQFNQLLYGYLSRLMILTVLYFVFFMIYRATILINDVYFYDSTMQRFLDRIHELIDDRYLDFLKKFTYIIYFPYIAILILRFVLFYPVVFNIQVFLRFYSIYVFTLLIRALSVVFTSIPSPHPDCVPLVKEASGFKTFVSMMIFKDQPPCTGVLFCPEAYVAILGFIIFAQNTDVIWSIGMLLYAGFVSVAMVTTKKYYSFDALFSLMFSAFFYYFYFTRIDTVGVQVINKINNKYTGTNLQLNQTHLETSVVNGWVASVEQIPKLILLGYRIRRLLLIMNENDDVDPKLLRKFKTIVFLFGLAKCKDLLTLYRGSTGFNFSYWKNRKNKYSVVKI